MTHSKVDANQPQIVRELRDLGISVQSIASVGDGCPDIICGYRGRTYGPYEIKMPGGKLTPDEKDWWGEWNGDGTIVRCTEDVLRDIGVTAT